MTSSSPPVPPLVTLLTADDALAERVVTLAGVAGVALDRPVLPVRGGRPGVLVARAALVLVGADVADPDHEAHPQGLHGAHTAARCVVLAPSPPGPDVWRHALAIGAGHVALLPEGEGWLVETLLEAGSGAPSGVVVGVVGGRGGAGASTLAVAFALAGARRRLRPLLVDTDRFGGGIDLLLGAEGAPGLRWDDVADVRGRLQAGQLAAGCPEVDGVRLLSWGAGGLVERAGTTGVDLPPPVSVEAMTAVLDAAVRECGLTVLDLPRAAGPAETVAVERCDVVVLVVPAEVRAAAAAVRVAGALRSRVADLRLVVRGPAPTGLPAEAVADLVGLPLTAALAAEPGLAVLLDRGEAAAIRPRGGLARFAERFVGSLEPAAGGAAGVGGAGRAGGAR